jgi:hypothetical protein
MRRLDPRLGNRTLLALAAQRALIRRGQPPYVVEWPESEGMSTLLDAAKHLPTRDPWALPDLEDTRQEGLAGLLAQARARLGERP